MSDTMIRSEIRDMLSELCWLAQAYEAKEFGGNEMEDVIDDRTNKILALITKSNHELLYRIERELPERKPVVDQDYSTKVFNKTAEQDFFNQGCNNAIDQTKATIDRIRGEL